MNTHSRENRDYGFGIGLLAGAFVGAGLLMWLAPRMGSELRERMTESARRLRDRASDQYRQASTHLGGAVDQLSRKAQVVRDDVADAVARGAHEVERAARAAKSDPVAASTHSPADGNTTM